MIERCKEFKSRAIGLSSTEDAMVFDHLAKKFGKMVSGGAGSFSITLPALKELGAFMEREKMESIWGMNWSCKFEDVEIGLLILRAKDKVVMIVKDIAPRFHALK